MDRRCVACRVPLVDSGTLGLQGHVQVIVPHVSEPYGSQSDPMERAIPVCTLKYFPQTIEHSVQFARDKFEAMFLVKPWELKNLLAIAATQEPGGDYLKRLHLQTQIMLAKYCYRLPKTFSDCLRYGLSVFRKYFQHKIQRILAKHPRDSLADDGNLFWSPPKRMPHPIEFDQDNPLHIDFIWSFATIQARIFCVEAPREEDISLVKSSLALDARDDGFEDFKQALVSASVEQINDVFCREFYKLQISPDLIAPAPFEKDDDRNQHVRFVYALANLRAENYDIPNESFLKIKQIAGKIIPAISTTTAVVSGLVAAEFVKILKGSPIENLRNSFLNLGISFFSLSEPAPPPILSRVGSEIITPWSKWSFEMRDQTLGELLQELREKVRLPAESVLQGNRLVYLDSMPSHRKRAHERLSDLFPIASADCQDPIIHVGFDENGQTVQSPAIVLRRSPLMKRDRLSGAHK
eukprot:TRINITY_DN3903_c0_g1_i6.p2 TRINITY_DN3903_c0_g1~~TRINITY_DN3903_c0_g1_i6.p2  ORF type:complete len:466 (-),score=92.46 TRINITY_DN3903_c0_g1_i6:178-1575(-)